MKLIFRLTYYVWMLCLLFSSCRSDKDYPEAMQKAIACMESHPDSAKIYLASLDSVIADEPEETRMYHALLTTKVAYKHYRVPDSDTILKKVAAFYKQNNDREKLMEAYYYLSTYYQERQDVAKAIHYSQQAADAGKDSRNFLSLCRIHADWGTLLAYQLLFEEAMEQYRQSYAYAVQCSKQSSAIYALRNIGRMFDALHQCDSSSYYYQRAYQLAILSNHTRSVLSIGRELANMYLDWGWIDSAQVLFTRMPEHDGNALYLKGKGRLFQLLKQPDSARFYYRAALLPGNEGQNVYILNSIHRQLAQMESDNQQWKEAAQHAEIALALEDSIENLTRTESIGKLQSLYNYQHIQAENEQLKHHHQLSVIYLICVSCLVLLSVICLYYRHRRKLLQEKEQALRLLTAEKEKYNQSVIYIEENERRINCIEQELAQLSAERDDLTQKLLHTEKNRLLLSNRHIRIRRSERRLLENQLRTSAIYLFFHQDLSEEKETAKLITEQHWDELRTQLDSTYDNITERLIRLYPQITTFELRLCYLVKIQLPMKRIAAILCRSLSGISNCRTRLYKKIHNKEGHTDDFDKFILEF